MIANKIPELPSLGKQRRQPQASCVDIVQLTSSAEGRQQLFSTSRFAIRIIGENAKMVFVTGMSKQKVLNAWWLAAKLHLDIENTEGNLKDAEKHKHTVALQKMQCYCSKFKTFIS
jgi:hypothetical protein